MARKIFYSKPLKYFWKSLYGTQKKFTPELTEEQIFYILKRNLMSNPLKNGETQESRQLLISGLDLWRTDSKGDLLHIFFLDRQLRDFLQETKLSDLNGIKKFLTENGQIHDVFRTYENKVTKNIVYQFALHLPFEAEGYAFSLSIEDDGSLELYFSQGENGGRMSDNFFADVNKKDDEISVTLSNMYRLAINTVAYMNCFPDCVAEGVPQNLFDRSGGKSDRNITFQLSEKIKDIGNSATSKMPHFRKGHFRLLLSDYFANKKGQVVFVAETMVKGIAKTVSMTPNIDEFIGPS